MARMNTPRRVLSSVLVAPIRKLRSEIHGAIERHQNDEIRKWKRLGRPVPPPHVHKEAVVAAYGKRYGCRILIETGTYLGEMVGAQQKRFKSIYSIELSDNLYKEAAAKFKNTDNIHLLQGDSAVVLPELLLTIRDRSLFWLDGHYSAGITAKGSKESPILDEVSAILDHGLRHVLLIDDARMFVGENDYPKIEHLEEIIKRRRRNLKEFVVRDDIIRVVL
jgi:hypothetical protein